MSSTENSLKEEIRNFFTGISKGPNFTRVLVGFSGGADSLCLALLLSECAEDINIKPALACLDHGIRSCEEMEAEGKFVRDFASRTGLELYTESIPHGELKEFSDKEGRSLEETAREYRYAFFSRVIEKEGFDYLALGHHQDDQIETQIMRFFQGSGSAGLGGMDGKRENIIRPLLNIGKKQIISFLEERGEVWLSDSTNFENDYLRNSVRNVLVPEIEKVFPGYRKALGSLKSKMDDIEEFIDFELTERVMWTPEEDGRGTYSMDYQTFSETPVFLLIQSFYRLYNLTFPGAGRIPYRFFNSIAAKNSIMQACKESSDGNTLLSGYGIVIKVFQGRVFWTRDIVFPRKNSYLMLIKSDQSFSISGHEFKIETMTRSMVPEQGIYLRKKTVNPPFIVRSRTVGDEIELPEGKKSLKKLFNQWKIASEDRWKVPVIQDRNRILAVIGSPWGGSNRFAVTGGVKNKTDADECWFISWL